MSKGRLLIVTYLDRLPVKKGIAEALLAKHLLDLVSDCKVVVILVLGDLAMWGPQSALCTPEELAKTLMADLLPPAT